LLLDACQREANVEEMPLTGIASFTDLGDRVVLHTKDGSDIEGAAVIGADGLGSTIRQQMRNEGSPRMIGYVAIGPSYRWRRRRVGPIPTRW
jgi:salicylate hydroxylase